MCESNVYMKSDGKEELVMENVAVITPENHNKFILKGLFGDTMEISGDIDTINLISHKIVFKQ